MKPSLNPRPIPLDRDQILMVAKTLGRQANATITREGRLHDGGWVLGSATVQIADVAGKEHQVGVWLITRPTRGWFDGVTGGFERSLDRILIKIPVDEARDFEMLKQATGWRDWGEVTLMPTLLHEFTHARDVYSSKVSSQQRAMHERKDRAAYLNQPIEVRAKMQELADIAVRSIPEIKRTYSKPNRPPIPAVQWVLEQTALWREIEGDLSPAAQKKILLGVERALRDAGLETEGEGGLPNPALPSDLGPLYHGTHTERSALAIIEAGKLLPNMAPADRYKGKRGGAAPVQGRVYATTKFSYALIYALGWNGAGDPLDKRTLERIKEDGRYGWIFEVKPLNPEDSLPDEDQIGNLAVSNVDPELTALAMRLGQIKTSRGSTLWRDAKYEGLYFSQTRLGKIILRNASNTLLSRCMKLATQFALADGARIMRAWRVDKMQTGSMKQHDDSTSQPGIEEWTLTNPCSAARNPRLVPIGERKALEDAAERLTDRLLRWAKATAHKTGAPGYMMQDEVELPAAGRGSTRKVIIRIVGEPTVLGSRRFVRGGEYSGNYITIKVMADRLRKSFGEREVDPLWRNRLRDEVLQLLAHEMTHGSEHHLRPGYSKAEGEPGFYEAWANDPDEIRANARMIWEQVRGDLDWHVPIYQSDRRTGKTKLSLAEYIAEQSPEYRHLSKALGEKGRKKILQILERELREAGVETQGGGALPNPTTPTVPKPGTIRVFHGTSREKAELIKQQGLTSPSMGYASARWYMVAKDFASAAFHADGHSANGVVIEFEVPIKQVKRRWEGFPYLWPPHEVEWEGSKTRWYALMQPLPPEFIRSVSDAQSNPTRKPFAVEITSDIEDAVEYYWFTFRTTEHDGTVHFTAKPMKMPVQEILQWDDYSSWGGFKKGELVGLSKADLKAELDSYRAGYGNRALPWVENGKIPPVVLVDSIKGQAIGDGRGRTSLAVGLNLPALDVIVLKQCSPKTKGAMEFRIKNMDLERRSARNPTRRPVDTSALELVELTEGGITFKTGQPVKIRYLHNTEKSGYYGSQFQQNIEPAGFYMNHVYYDVVSPPPGWEQGTAELRSPLVLRFTTDGPIGTLYGPGSWKARLHNVFKAKGCALTRKLRKAGYDSIVTVVDRSPYPANTAEIVLLPEDCKARRKQ